MQISPDRYPLTKRPPAAAWPHPLPSSTPHPHKHILLHLSLPPPHPKGKEQTQPTGPHPCTHIIDVLALFVRRAAHGAVVAAAGEEVGLLQRGGGMGGGTAKCEAPGGTRRPGMPPGYQAPG